MASIKREPEEIEVLSKFSYKLRLPYFGISKDNKMLCLPLCDFGEFHVGSLYTTQETSGIVSPSSIILCKSDCASSFKFCNFSPSVSPGIFVSSISAISMIVEMIATFICILLVMFRKLRVNEINKTYVKTKV